jgi:CDGSH-type Zn-finger protein/uncharacterized Fe-S cluster protein YjdI
MTTERYEGTRLTVLNHAERCIHSRYCVLGRPGVFIPNADGPWIAPDAGTTEAVVALIERCPSGALAYERKDGGAAESVPPVNNVRIQENGPLAIHADMRMEGFPDAGYRATLCRCGQSENKPYCDNSHRAAGFEATGEVPTRPSAPLLARGGPLTITPAPNGPLLVVGPLELCAAFGRTIDRVERTALCRCGASGNKPFCDGSHARVGFVAP